MSRNESFHITRIESFEYFTSNSKEKTFRYSETRARNSGRDDARVPAETGIHLKVSRRNGFRTVTETERLFAAGESRCRSSARPLTWPT